MIHKFKKEATLMKKLQKQKSANQIDETEETLLKSKVTGFKQDWTEQNLSNEKGQQDCISDSLKESEIISSSQKTAFKEKNYCKGSFLQENQELEQQNQQLHEQIKKIQKDHQQEISKKNHQIKLLKQQNLNFLTGMKNMQRQLERLEKAKKSDEKLNKSKIQYLQERNAMLEKQAIEVKAQMNKIQFSDISKQPLEESASKRIMKKRKSREEKQSLLKQKQLLMAYKFFPCLNHPHIHFFILNGDVIQTNGLKRDQYNIVSKYSCNRQGISTLKFKQINAKGSFIRSGISDLHSTYQPEIWKSKKYAGMFNYKGNYVANGHIEIHGKSTTNNGDVIEMFYDGKTYKIWWKVNGIQVIESCLPVQMTHQQELFFVISMQDDDSKIQIIH